MTKKLSAGSGKIIESYKKNYDILCIVKMIKYDLIPVNLDSFEFMFGMTICYIGTVNGIQLYMHGQNAYSLKYLMLIYNMIQVLLNIYMVSGLCILPFLPESPNIFGLNAPYNDRIKYFLEVHYLSKFLDYFDTIFMALRKKDNQISFLHIYHHSSIVFIWGFLSNIGHNDGTAGFGALANSIIHTIMYSHYFVTSLGYKNPFKKIITQAQIVQFTLCILHTFFVFWFEKVYPKPIGIIQLLYHIHMLTLFGDFYVYTYKKPIE